MSSGVPEDYINDVIQSMKFFSELLAWPMAAFKERPVAIEVILSLLEYT